MSTFWNRRQTKLGRHKHLPEDILTDAGNAVPTGGGGLTNPLLEPLAITSVDPNALVVTGGTAASSTDLFLLKASDGTVLFGSTAGDGAWTFRIDGSSFAFQQSSGAFPGQILRIDEYGTEFKDSAAGYLLFIDRSGGKIGFFNTPTVVQPAPIADATDPASTMARLNNVLTALRALGLIDT